LLPSRWDLHQLFSFQLSRVEYNSTQDLALITRPKQ